MRKIFFFILAMILCLWACGNQQKPQTAQLENNNNQLTESASTVSGDIGEVPPVLVSCVKGLPLFAPFNDGDILNEGRTLKQSPEKYTKLIMFDQVFDVSYKEEKNKNLEHDESYLNQYVYKNKDAMKGQLFDYANPKAIDEFLQTHGDMNVEGHAEPLEYTEGILVSADYLQGRSVLPFMATTTEDPDAPEFPAEIVKKVEKMLGESVEKNRISSILGKDEYKFGVMRTRPNAKYGIAAWVLARGSDVCVWTDTCEVDAGEGRIYWSNYDPDEYMEPNVVAVVKGKNGLDIYTMHMSTDETANYYLMRQEGTQMKRSSLGGFYQMYE
ncbi:MAG: hypothetical protein IKX61_05605 [Prevotella sp.]|nr:hypothetical protein [Prevotella sp.]